MLQKATLFSIRRRLASVGLRPILSREESPEIPELLKCPVLPREQVLPGVIDVNLS